MVTREGEDRHRGGGHAAECPADKTALVPAVSCCESHPWARTVQAPFPRVVSPKWTLAPGPQGVPGGRSLNKSDTKWREEEREHRPLATCRLGGAQGTWQRGPVWLCGRREQRSPVFPLASVWLTRETAMCVGWLLPSAPHSAGPSEQPDWQRGQLPCWGAPGLQDPADLAICAPWGALFRRSQTRFLHPRKSASNSGPMEV